ncbi:MAG: HU family DNA-binding protein [bacterium]|jgi:integration host factor subunit beta
MDEMISELAQGNRLEFRDFGVFEPKQRAARHGQNPKTLERVQVPAKRTVKFKLGRVMKEKVLKLGVAK